MAIYFVNFVKIWLHFFSNSSTNNIRYRLGTLVVIIVGKFLNHDKRYFKMYYPEKKCLFVI